MNILTLLFLIQYYKYGYYSTCQYLKQHKTTEIFYIFHRDTVSQFVIKITLYSPNKKCIIPLVNIKKHIKLKDENISRNCMFNNKNYNNNILSVLAKN